MQINIFYSWQSNLPSKANRSFIETAILRAVKKINLDPRTFSILDRDTKNTLGSPNITDTIFYKINHCKFFICDISFVDINNNPNPNVLIELGYAIKTLGWQKIICLFNKATGNVEKLPFDINHNRVTAFDPTQSNERNRIADIIKDNIDNLFRKGQLYNPIEDHLKGKIDYEILKIVRNLIFAMRFEEEVNYSKCINEISEQSIEEIANLLSSKPTLGFYYRYNYAECLQNLEELLDKLLSCDYFHMSWREALIRFITWIDVWQHSMDEHFSPSLLKYVNKTQYAIHDMHKENPSNPQNSVLLLMPINGNQFRVIQSGIIINKEFATDLVVINKDYANNIARQIKDFFDIIEFWMNESGNEFILEPRHYLIDKFYPMVHEVQQ